MTSKAGRPRLSEATIPHQHHRSARSPRCQGSAAARQLPRSPVTCSSFSSWCICIAAPALRGPFFVNFFYARSIWIFLLQFSLSQLFFILFFFVFRLFYTKVLIFCCSCCSCSCLFCLPQATLIKPNSHPDSTISSSGSTPSSKRYDQVQVGNFVLKHISSDKFILRVIPS